MKSIWRWVLGVILVLVVVGAVTSFAFVWRNHATSVASFRIMPFDRGRENPLATRL